MSQSNEPVSTNSVSASTQADVSQTQANQPFRESLQDTKNMLMSGMFTDEAEHADYDVYDDEVYDRDYVDQGHMQQFDQGDYEQRPQHLAQQNIAQQNIAQQTPEQSHAMQASAAQQQVSSSQSDAAIAETPAQSNLVTQPTVITDTTQASDEPYVPMLPQPVESEQKRQLILDTETTGLEAHNGDRIIEIGVVEVINRRFTGEKLHVYLDPERGMDAGAVAVHGITSEFLAGKPKFASVAQQVLDFLKGGEIIAHNAPFDIGFLNAEFTRVGIKDFDSCVTVTDSLAVAKAKYPGQKNSLDALVKRLNILTKDRTFHGALLDAEILADVYLTMTGGQVKLGLGETSASLGAHQQFAQAAALFAFRSASEHDVSAHHTWLDGMTDKSERFAEHW